MIEKLKSGIEMLKAWKMQDRGLPSAELCDVLITLAEAAVESEGLPEKEIIHIEEALPAFALLQGELNAAKREINHLHECLNSLNASLDKQRLEDMGVENARLAAFEARVKGITEEDVLKLFCEHRKKCGFDAKTCTFIAASLLALVRGE